MSLQPTAKQRQPELYQAVLNDIDTFRVGLGTGNGFEATPDIDMVWSLSGHGTYDSTAKIPPYDPAVSYDRLTVDTSVRTVQEVTALRTGKDVDEVTKADIEEIGPMFFFCGETAETPNHIYPHIEALKRAMASPDFPLPRNKVVLRVTNPANTPIKMKVYTEYRNQQIEKGEIPASKIAVVGLFTFLPRVGRYLPLYRDGLKGDPSFIPVPVPYIGRGVEDVIAGEAERTVAYFEKGHLSTESGFPKAS
jgi:hypothetical protein